MSDDAGVHNKHAVTLQGVLYLLPFGWMNEYVECFVGDSGTITTKMSMCIG